MRGCGPEAGLATAAQPQQGGGHGRLDGAGLRAAPLPRQTAAQFVGALRLGESLLVAGLAVEAAGQCGQYLGAVRAQLQGLRVFGSEEPAGDRKRRVVGGEGLGVAALGSCRERGDASAGGTHMPSRRRDRNAATARPTAC
ncbi:hypothetical protein GCM10010415_65640 [Streptomyces atrovirens]|uniref:Uncharacterized protein n=1 Tax=Streptomyces atrovirens TaxID=285556 RepID=A0ABW0DPA8_9ACTN